MSVVRKTNKKGKKVRHPVHLFDAGDSHAVLGCNGLQPKKEIVWNVDDGAAFNYQILAQCLVSCGDLYRHHADGHALVQILPGGKTRLIGKGRHLASIIVDRVKMQVVKNDKVVGDLPSGTHLNAMLRSEIFLSQFLPVDEVVTEPVYGKDFFLVQPGYHDGGEGWRILYLGKQPEISNSTETIKKFLDVMEFATNADRTNTVAAALTVLFRRFWRGEKPAVLVTATKSHAGKGTVTNFFRGSCPKADILFESIDWPMQSQFQRQLQCDPDLGLVVFDNVRCDSAGGRVKFIRSGFIESFVTSAEVTLASPGAGESIRLENKYVVTINTNEGKLSPDLMNRALPIHLAPKGSVQERQSPIGDPKLEFLPQNRNRIEEELRGMVERWKKAGCPLDNEVKHSMIQWARTIGGILNVNGFKDFLGNCDTRKTIDDPIREALGILGTVCHDKPLTPKEWANHVVEQGLTKTLLPVNERDTPKSRERAIGVVLKRYIEETFRGSTDTKVFHFQLERGCRRWTKGKNPHVRYSFKVLKEESLPVEEDAKEQK